MSCAAASGDRSWLFAINHSAVDVELPVSGFDLVSGVPVVGGMLRVPAGGYAVVRESRGGRAGVAAGMSGLLIGAVLFAAVLHAGWNAIAKWIPDRLVASALIGVAFAVGGAIGALLFRCRLHRPGRSSSRRRAAGRIHVVADQRLLAWGVRPGVSAGPRVVAGAGDRVAVTLLGEQLNAAELLGVALLCSALGALVLVKGLPRRGDGLGLAVLTGVTIAAYTLVDGVGVTRTDNPFSYAAWLFLLQGVALVLRLPDCCPGLCWAGLVARMREHLGPGLSAACCRLIAYAIVLWAQSFGNLALVSALRETSVLFAGIIAVVLFKERQTRVQVLALVLAAAGIVLVKVA